MTKAKQTNGKLSTRDWAGAEPFRPPWFRAEATTTGLCDACGRCIQACPKGLLVAGFDGAPEIDFTRGGCDFCGACLAACVRGAFRGPGHAEPWPYKADITGACLAFQGVECALCEDHCKANAISFRHFAGGFALAEVSADACTGCGACVATCPALAVTMLSPDGIDY